MPYANNCGSLCVLSQSARCSSWPPTPYREHFIKVKRWFPSLMWRKAFFTSTCVCSLRGPRGQASRVSVGPCFMFDRQALFTKVGQSALERVSGILLSPGSTIQHRGELGAVRGAEWRSIHRSPGQSQMASIHPTGGTDTHTGVKTRLQ